jgi:Na+(H+)/acetate symporter ActP
MTQQVNDALHALHKSHKELDQLLFVLVLLSQAASVPSIKERFFTTAREGGRDHQCNEGFGVEPS